MNVIPLQIHALEAPPESEDEELFREEFLGAPHQRLERLPDLGEHLFGQLYLTRDRRNPQGSHPDGVQGNLVRGFYRVRVLGIRPLGRPLSGIGLNVNRFVAKQNKQSGDTAPAQETDT